MKQKQSRKGYNQVAYIRHGTDHITSHGSGPNTVSRRKTEIVTARNGQKWEIPVDSNGKVPKDVLWARFLDESQGDRQGHRRDVYTDIMSNARTMHKIPRGGFTPRQLIETGWYQYPNESDIWGIDGIGDDGSSPFSFAGQLAEAAKSAQVSGLKMPMLMPPEEQERARKILARSFTGAEIKRAVKNHGLVIMEGNPGPNASGCYVPRQTGSSMNVPVIILRKGWNEETLIHEFTHHLRAVDSTRGGFSRSPFTFDEDGREISHQPEYESKTNLEEAATVSESLARLHNDTLPPNGYFWRTKIGGDTPEARYWHDRDVLAGPKEGRKPARGRRAEKRTAARFKDTSMAGLKVKGGKKALDYYNQREAAGTLPVAIKPVKKKSGGVATAGVSGGVPAPALASLSRRPKGSRAKHSRRGRR